MKGPVVTVQTDAQARSRGQLAADRLEPLVRAAIDTVDMFREAVSR